MAVSLKIVKITGGLWPRLKVTQVSAISHSGARLRVTRVSALSPTIPPPARSLRIMKISAFSYPNSKLRVTQIKAISEAHAPTLWRRYVDGEWEVLVGTVKSYAGNGSWVKV